MNKLFRANELYLKMKELGLPTGKLWVLREEAAGRFNPRKTPKGWRMFTQKDIQQIIREYSPGGSGRWTHEGQ